MAREIQLVNSQFFVPTEQVGRFLSRMHSKPFVFGFDDNGNIIGVEFTGQKDRDDWDYLKTVAEYVQNGSFVEFHDECGEQWRFVFDGGKVSRIEARRVWGDGSAEQIQDALDIAFRYASYAGDHHKTWTIDQMVRALCGSDEEYQRWVKEYEEPDENGESYEWSTGIAP